MKKNEDVEYGRLLGRAEAEEKGREAGALAPVPKDLQVYAGSLPYQRDRVIEEIRFLLQHELAAKYEIGKRLILIKEMEEIRHGGDRKSEDAKSKRDNRTLIDVLEEHLPGLAPRRAHEYMLFARKATQKFKDWAEGGKNWTKALALLDTFDEKELKAFEDGESVRGVDMDEVDVLTVAELRERLRRRDKRAERLEAELEKKTEELDRLQKGFKPTEEQFHVMLEGYKVHFDRLLMDIEPEAMWDKLGATREVKEGKKEKPTIRMKAHYIEFIGYLKKCIMAAAGGAEEMYGTPDMFPENVWRPGEGAEIVKAFRENGLKKLEEKKTGATK